MPSQGEAALITSIIAFLVAILGNILTFLNSREQFKQNRKDQELALNKFREEQEKWIINLQTAYELEKYKARIASYFKAFEIIGKLSHKAREPVTPEKAKQVAYELNDWFYSNGGMCAETSTRGAIRFLRNACLNWAKKENKPSDLYEWRNRALLLLRSDLDIKGLESFDNEDPDTLIKRAKKAVADATKKEIAQETKEETAK